MADPKQQLNPVTINFVDTSPTVSQSVPVTAANPLPVTLTSGTTDQDVNIVSVGGNAVTTTLPIAGTVQPGNTPNTTPWLVQSSFSVGNITTSTTTTVKSGAGVLHGINVNSKGTIASAAVVYDNTAGSGTKIATIDTLNLAGWNQFDAAFATGLTIVTTGTVAPDISVMYR